MASSADVEWVAIEGECSIDSGQKSGPSPALLKDGLPCFEKPQAGSFPFQTCLKTTLASEEAFQKNELAALQSPSAGHLGFFISAPPLPPPAPACHPIDPLLQYVCSHPPPPLMLH